MSKAENAVAWALQIAADNAHGYDQASRWGVDYDCSSLVISAWDAAGVPLKAAGATYTGNMKRVFLANGFVDVTTSVNLATGAGMLLGDVLLHETKHTALHIGDGRIVHASGNEFGGATGGQKGDQTGNEIVVRSYYNHPWQCVLRYNAPVKPQDIVSPQPSTTYASVPELHRGHRSASVEALQVLLMLRGEKLPLFGADGDFGDETNFAVLSFQKRAGLTVDGEVGRRTWAKLISG